MVSSHQTKDPEHFSDSSNIPKNPPTIHCPNLTATAKQMSLLSLCALLFLKSHLFLICVVLTYNDSRISLHKTCLILRKCQCKWLWVSLSAPRTFVRSFLFPEKFLFCTGKIVSTVLPSLVPQYSISMIVAWFTSFAKNSVIRCYQTTRIFRSRHDCTGASSARCPR